MSMYYRGNEPIAGVTLSSYWAWAHSDLLSNAERGIFAEWLVHKAMHSDSPSRVNWDRYDVLSPEGIRIEVKTSGYVQTWKQKKLSAPVFSIRQTYARDENTDTAGDELSRPSDVYVFCLHHHKDRNTIDPLDITQWTFYVLSTAALDAAAGRQKTIALSRLKDIGAAETGFSGLRAEVLRSVKHIPEPAEDSGPV